MWRIKKKAPPVELQEWTQKYAPTGREKGWRELHSKVRQVVQRQLWEEQRGLCCYCQRQLPPPPGVEKGENRWSTPDGAAEGRRVEHFKPQASFPTLRFDYYNLFLSCDGGEGGPKSQYHCDKSKGEVELVAINLTGDPPIEQLIRYRWIRGEVEILPSEPKSPLGEKLKEEIDKVLNLNCGRLRRARSVVLGHFLDQIKSTPVTGWGYWVQLIETSIPAPPFGGMLLFFLTHFQRRE